MATSSKSKPKKSNGKGKGLPQIETPSYPAFVGSNLPTGGDTDPGGEQDAFDAVVPDALVADTMKPESVLISMPHLPANTCYRNSAVAALLNIAPFVNYVQSVAAEKNRENPLAQSLAGLADVFRDVDMDSETARLSKLNKRMSVFWKWLRQQPKSNDEDRWSPTAWAAEVGALYFLSATLGLPFTLLFKQSMSFSCRGIKPFQAVSKKFMILFWQHLLTCMPG